MKNFARLSRIPLHLRLSFALTILCSFSTVGTPPPPGIPPPQTIDDYFESIRHDRAALTVFFEAMPKGGDLHCHLTGAIYGEYWLNLAIDQRLWVNLQTLALSSTPPQGVGCVRLDTFCQRRDFPALKQRLLQDWSIKDFYPGMAPPDQHFFDAFGKFPRLPYWGDTHRALFTLKTRAKTENVSYLEMMLWACDFRFDTGPYEGDVPSLRLAALAGDTIAAYREFDRLFAAMKNGALAAAGTYADSLSMIHNQGIDDGSYTMRYQLAVSRNAPPLNVFRALLGSFTAAHTSPLLGGVNFVSNENGDTSMFDYHLHMLMFRYLHRQFPDVRFSLHAGELTIGLVQPEDLTWHIHDAIFTADADRIGHGVDMPWELGSKGTMQLMSTRQKAIEINLSSNEFILGVRDDAHPVMLYFNNKVPIVISTDDPGILRTSLSEQYVLLALRYPGLHYSDIRQFTLNSIEYSFIKDPVLKQRILTDLQQRLTVFEQQLQQLL